MPQTDGVNERRDVRVKGPLRDAIHSTETNERLQNGRNKCLNVSKLSAEGDTDESSQFNIVYYSASLVRTAVRFNSGA